jgi:hypothetical protein
MFSGEISIKVGPKSFEFSRKDLSFRVRPVVLLSPGSDGSRVLAVGDEVAPAGPYIRVHLFEPSDHQLGPVEKFECLAALIRFGLIRLQGRGTMVRPRVYVSGLSSLSEFVGGYEGFILWKAVMNAGAWECHLLT